MSYDTDTLERFIDAVGLSEEPFGMYYTDQKPDARHHPHECHLPTLEDEARGEVDWRRIDQTWCCYLGHLVNARRKKTSAWFSASNFGCLGGAFYMGYLDRQLEAICRYVSTGTPGNQEGEHFMESPEATRKFFEDLKPEQAPAPYLVFKPLSQFTADEKPLLVIMFGGADIMSGLQGLVMYTTNDPEAVATPFGAGCTGMITWPLKYLRAGRPKAVLGGWDPSVRKLLKADEMHLSMPLQMFEPILARWEESFLTKPVWQGIRKRIEKNRQR